MEKSQSAATAWQEKFISSSDKKKVQRNKDMAQIYIAFVDTPGFFAGIDTAGHQTEVHSCGSFDGCGT